MTAFADNYTVASGGIINAGFYSTITPPTDLPDWVPAVGTFSDISLNTLYSVKPSGWPNNDVSGPFLNWAGGVFAPDFSEDGALILRGSGHLSPTLPTWAGNWAFDFSTREWVGCNIPGSPLLEYPPNTEWYNEYYESIKPESLGHVYPPHTYDGLVYRSAAAGGSPKGNLIANCSPGGVGVPKYVHEYDLSSSTAAPNRIINDIPIATSYVMADTDTSRNGYWVLTNNGAPPLIFVPFDDPTNYITYSNIGYGAYGDHSLIYLPEHDCLIGMGRNDGSNTTFALFVCPIINDIPQGFTPITYVGTPPADGRSGGVWSTILQKVVSYEAGRSLRVHHLTPPAPGSNLITGQWTWTNETLTADLGQLPSNPGLNSNNGLPYAENGSWGRFVEVPNLRSFAWCNGVNSPVQLWRLQGME